MTHIILVRHGQTAWNRVERFRGRADIELNDSGLAQAEATARRIAAEWHPEAIYASPLSRARTTAQAIARRVALEVVVDAGLLDIDYGQWQGLTPDEAHSRWPEAIDAWYGHPGDARIPGGETLDVVRARAMGAVRAIAARHTGATIVVAHTVINRAIVLEALGLGNERFWRLGQDTCAINVLEVVGDVVTLVTLNDTCHLRSAGAW